MLRTSANKDRARGSLNLQTRLILYVILLLSFVMIITTYMGIRRESQGILDQMHKDGIALANAYALSVENAILLNAGLGRVTGDASRTKGVKYLKIVDADQRIIGHTDGARIGLAKSDSLYTKVLRTRISAVERGKNPVAFIDHDPDGTEIFRVLVPLVILEQVAGVLEVGLETSGISQAIRRTNNQSLGIGVIGFLFGGAYIWFFARSFTRPVKELVEAAERIAAGDLGSPIPITRGDELSQLAVAFNHMMIRLNASMENLRKTNAQLEEDAATIEELRRFTENILNSVSPGILTLDLQQTITSCNYAGAKLLGYPATAMVGKGLNQVLPSNCTLKTALKEAITLGRIYQNYELTFEATKAREEMIFSLNSAHLFDQTGQLIGVAVTFEDITTVMQLQKKVHETEKLAALGGLAAGFAHEVRNPLGAIKTSAQFLQNKLDATDFRYRFTQLMIREVERLDQLVERLLTFTRPSEKDLQYQDIHALIDEMLTIAVLKFDAQKLVITKEYGNDLPHFFVDGKRLQQAFLNILLNAVDAMVAGGELIIKTAFESEKQLVTIEFGNTGTEIPVDLRQKIFEPFFTTKPRGSGLGLAIVKQIVLEHNGKIEVDTMNGKGTVFKITLPLERDSFLNKSTSIFV